MPAQNKLVAQFSRPAGVMGRIMLWRMNWHHSLLTDWGLSHIAIPAQGSILDIGCGGGRTLQKLAAAAPQGKVYGVDYSETSVAASRKSNAAPIRSGKMTVQQASVSALPFPADTFSLVTAVETHFFWPSLSSDVCEVFRVVRPGGTLLLIAELYRGTPAAPPEKVDRAAAVIGMNLLTADGHRTLLAEAGFIDVQVAEKHDKGWICVFGKKPA